MPVLYTEPLSGHRRIAIVEAWGTVGQEEQVLAALRSRGCETGADALVIVEATEGGRKLVPTAEGRTYAPQIFRMAIEGDSLQDIAS